MLPEQRGLLVSWFSQFRTKRKQGDKAARKRTQRGASFSRNRTVESLEDRRMLTNTIYVDFGTRLSATTMAESAIGNTGGWNTFGYNPAGTFGGNWVFGPDFNIAGNPQITYTPLRDVFNAKADPNVTAPFSFLLGSQQQNFPWEDQTGTHQPPSQLDALENSIMNMIAQAYAPFNVSVQLVTSTGFGGPGSVTAPPTTPAGFLAQNNPLFDPTTFDPANPPTTPAAIAALRGPQFNAMQVNSATTAPDQYQDVYILIGGWTLGTTQIGNPASGTGNPGEPNAPGILGIFGAAPQTFNPGVRENDPTFKDTSDIPNMRLLYSDGGVAVNADTIIDRWREFNTNPKQFPTEINVNVTIAQVAAQGAAETWGAFPTHDGLAKPWNPFFDTNVDLLSSSDIMRQGPYTSTEYPTDINRPIFENFYNMLGSSNEDTGNVQNVVQQFLNDPDIGQGQYAYVSGTGAFDKITITAAANPSRANVTVLPYSDSSFADSSFISTFAVTTAHPNGYMTSIADPYTYQINISNGFMLIEAGNSADQISIDPTIFSSFVAQPTKTFMQVFIFGGQESGGALDNISFTSNGTQNVFVTPGNSNPQLANFEKDYETQIDIPTVVGPNIRNTDIQMFEFDDASVVHLDNFNSMAFDAPLFLPADLTVDREHNFAMMVDGTVGVGGSVGMSNVEFINIPTVMISHAQGATNDSVTVDTIDPVDPTTTGFAAGLQNFSVVLGAGDDSLTVIGPIDLPGSFTYDGGAGTDTIKVDDATDWTLTDSGLTDALGTTISFVNKSVEVADITGEGDPTFTVDDWSGDATLTGVVGGDTFNIGQTLGVIGNLTINAGGFIGDKFNIGKFAGVGTITGTSGNDVFNINTSTIAMSSAASGTGTSTAYFGAGVGIKTTTGSNVIKVVSGFGTFAVGQRVIGPNIPTGATILSISGTNLTISAVATGSSTNTCVIGVVGGTGTRGITQVSLNTTTGKKAADVVGNFRITAGLAIVGNANVPANTNLVSISNISIDGGDGDDSFYVKNWNGTGDLHGGAGDDSFFIGTFSTSSPSGDGVIQAITQQHNIVGDAGNDTLTLDDSGNNSAANYTIENKTVTDNSNLFGGLGFDITLENLKLIGSQGANTFDVTPDVKTAINVNGVLPTTSPGDVLKVDVSGTKGAKFVANGPNGGTLSFTSGQRAITFSNIETTMPDLAQVGTAQQQQQQADLLSSLLTKMQNDPLLVVAGEAGATGAALVKVYDVHNGTNTLLFSFSAYEAGFKGGVRATLIPDIDAIPDGIPDIVVAPGSGRLGEVKVYSGAMLAAGAATAGTHVVSNPDLALLSGASLVPVNTTAGSNVVTLPIVGLDIGGANIVGGTTVTSINNTTTIGISQAATATGTVTATIGGNIVVTLKTTAGKSTATVSSIVNIGGLVVGQSVAGSNQVAVTTTLGSKVLSVATTVGLGLFVGEPLTGFNIPGNAIVTAIGSNTITISSAAIGSGATVAAFDPIASNTTATAFKLTLSGITITLSNKVNSTSSVNSLFAASFLPEAATYKGGIYVAAGDLNGDGSIQIVTSRSSTVPNVEVFNASDLLIGNPTPIAKFNPYTSKYITGAQIAVGDVDGDTQDEIVTAPGSGQSALVEVFNYDEVQTQLNNSLPVIAARSFLGFESQFKNGVSLSVGDFDGPDVNGAMDQIAVGAGTNGTSRIRIFDEFGTQVAPEFKAFTTSANSPLRIEVVNDPNTSDADRRAILFVGQVNAAKSHVIKEFKFTSAGLGFAIDGSFVDTLVESDPAMTNGVFLG